jgi:diadenosine tetraphosphate (Ap4A) HIT family hydrolase
MKELNNSMQGQNTSHLHMHLTNRYDWTLVFETSFLILQNK